MNDNRFRRLFDGSELTGSDWSLSLGYRCHLVTDAPTAVAGFRKGAGLIDELLLAQELDREATKGLAMKYTESRVYLIVIRACEEGVAVMPGRLIELIVHECSHVADYVFANAGVQACTETRAYFLDWLVGKAVNAVLPHLWEPLVLSAP